MGLEKHVFEVLETNAPQYLFDAYFSHGKLKVDDAFDDETAEETARVIMDILAKSGEFGATTYDPERREISFKPMRGSALRSTAQQLQRIVYNLRAEDAPPPKWTEEMKKQVKSKEPAKPEAEIAEALKKTWSELDDATKNEAKQKFAQRR